MTCAGLSVPERAACGADPELLDGLVHRRALTPPPPLPALPAGLVGGAGVVPGGNIGDDVAIFEQGARHVGKDLAGKNQANPTAALLSTAMMMRHLYLPNFSRTLERAVLKVYRDGDAAVIPQDVGGRGTLLSFTDAVIRNVETSSR